MQERLTKEAKLKGVAKAKDATAPQFSPLEGPNFSAELRKPWIFFCIEGETVNIIRKILDYLLLTQMQDS